MSSQTNEQATETTNDTAGEDAAPKDQEVQDQAAQTDVDQVSDDNAPGDQVQESPDPEEALAEPEMDTKDAAIQKLEEELAAARDRLLRVAAEAENVRRRATKENEDTRRYGAQNLAKELLPVADNLRRALESINPEARETTPVLDNLMTGVEMTEKMFAEALSRNQIRKTAGIGEKFSHQAHQAIGEIETTDVPPGHIAQVMQEGYWLHDRLLRPAMVIVAKKQSDPA